MTSGSLRWSTIASRREARILQQFSCTTDMPKSPGGRRLPHSKPWEYEAQRILRDTSHHLRPGESVLVGRVPSQGADVLAAAILTPVDDWEVAGIFIGAAAVSITARGRGGAVADAMMTAIFGACAEHARARSADRVLIMGKIHVNNRPSQLMVERVGFEPADAPTADYQTWLRLLSVIN